MNYSLDQADGELKGYIKCRYRYTGPKGQSAESDIWVEGGKIKEFCDECNVAYAPHWTYQPVDIVWTIEELVKAPLERVCVCSGHTLLWFGCTCKDKS